MKKTVLFFALIVMLFAFVGCATKATPVAVADNDAWWNNTPADTSEYHYEVGYAKGSNLQTSRDWAKANANQNLAQYVSNAIDSIVNTYVNDAGELATKNMQSLQAFESVSQQRAQATLTGVTYKYHENVDGSVYVLASLPIGPLAEQLKETMQESFSRNKASEAAMSDMNAAIDKYFSK